MWAIHTVAHWCLEQDATISEHYLLEIWETCVPLIMRPRRNFFKLPVCLFGKVTARQELEVKIKSNGEGKFSLLFDSGKHVISKSMKKKTGTLYEICYRKDLK